MFLGYLFVPSRYTIRIRKQQRKKLLRNTPKNMSKSKKTLVELKNIDVLGGFGGAGAPPTGSRGAHPHLSKPQNPDPLPEKDASRRHDRIGTLTIHD